MSVDKKDMAVIAAATFLLFVLPALMLARKRRALWIALALVLFLPVSAVLLFGVF